jgi:Crp-like helix-turn-helix domain
VLNCELGRRLAGMTRPTGNFVLRQLQRDGVIALCRDRIAILDITALRRASQ